MLRVGRAMFLSTFSGKDGVKKADEVNPVQQQKTFTTARAFLRVFRTAANVQCGQSNAIFDICKHRWGKDPEFHLVGRWEFQVVLPDGTQTTRMPTHRSFSRKDAHADASLQAIYLIAKMEDGDDGDAQDVAETWASELDSDDTILLDLK